MTAYLAIDPGETNGIAIFDSNGKLQELAQVPLQDLVPRLTFWISDYEITIVIIEDYKIYPHKLKDHLWNDLKTVRAIGRIEGLAQLYHLKVVFQMPNTKNSGYKFMGSKAPTKFRHQQDALAHGVYYLVTAGIVDASSLLQSDLP